MKVIPETHYFRYLCFYELYVVPCIFYCISQPSYWIQHHGYYCLLSYMLNVRNQSGKIDYFRCSKNTKKLAI